jgi:3-hydroxyisobutyrate dehydrogenase-like beta-hydroxyacid dehydrogenase
MKLAFLGLGRMGMPMARNLLRAGHQVTAYNRTPHLATLLHEEAGATAALTPAEAVRDAQAVITMLADDRAVELVTFDFVSTLAKGALHIGMSTISVELSGRLARLHAGRDQYYVAAPVFGRPEAAAAAKLWIVAAGAAEQIQRCRPVFDALGRGCSIVGPDPPLANVVKLAGNFLIAAALESLGEAFALVRKSGVEAAPFLEIINTALFNSPLYANYGRIVAKSRFEPPGFTVTLGFKDLRLVEEAAESAAVPMPLAGILRDRYLAALARGEADIDWAAIARIAAAQAGI